MRQDDAKNRTGLWTGVGQTRMTAVVRSAASQCTPEHRRQFRHSRLTSLPLARSCELRRNFPGQHFWIDWLDEMSIESGRRRREPVLVIPVAT